MALAYVLDRFESDPDVVLTNYAEYLEQHPPDWEVEIAENTSWSCAHGVERWRADCGCSTGARPDWSQAWRGPLREALDGLRDALAARFESEAEGLLADPWAARDDFIEIVLDGSPDRRAGFLATHAPRVDTPADRSRVWRLLEGQRHAMLMFTSCGWFFDDLDGIETRQILRYAGRALEIAGTAEMRSRFLSGLERASGNRPECGDGRMAFDDELQRSRVTSAGIAAWWAAASSTAGANPAAGTRPIFPAWDVDEESRTEDAVDGARLVIGRVRVASRPLGEADRFDFAALFRFAGDLHGGIRRVGPSDEGDQADLVGALRDRGIAGAMETLEDRYTLEEIGMETLARLRRAQPGHLGEALGAHAAEALVSLAERWTVDRDRSALRMAEAALDIVDGVPVTPDLWQAQNAWYGAVRSIDAEHTEIEPEGREQLMSIAARLGLSPGVAS
jgi:hypothetical protein